MSAAMRGAPSDPLLWTIVWGGWLGLVGWLAASYLRDVARRRIHWSPVRRALHELGRRSRSDRGSVDLVVFVIFWVFAAVLLFAIVCSRLDHRLERLERIERTRAAHVRGASVPATSIVRTTTTATIRQAGYRTATGICVRTGAAEASAAHLRADPTC